jgi:hypothetical protein
MPIDINNIRGKNLFVDCKLSIKKVFLYSLKIQLVFFLVLISIMTINHSNFSGAFSFNQIWDSLSYVITKRAIFLLSFFTFLTLVGTFLIYGSISLALRSSKKT